MAIYFIITFILILFSAVDIIKMKDESKVFLLFVLFLILAAFIGLRDNIGFDWKNYEEVFESQRLGLESPHRVEFGYLLLNKLFVLLGLSFSGLILFLAIISILIKVIAVRKFAPLFFIPLLYYLSYYLVEYEMSGMRQAVAMGFAMLSLVYVKERRLIPFLLCITAGSLFHVSLIIFIPIFYCDRLKFSTPTYLVLVFISFSFIFTNLSTFLLDIVAALPLGQFITSKLFSYAGVNEVTGLTIGHIPYIAFGILFVYYRRIVDEEFYNTLLNAYIIGLFFSFVFSGSLGVLNRLTYYYLMLGGVLFAYVLTNTKFMFNKIAIFGLLACFTLIKIAESTLDKNAYEYYVPYKTIKNISKLLLE